MSDELEAAGAAAHATLAARTIDAPSPSLPAAAHGQACANCGTVLQGAFCHGCGQTAHLHRSLLHLVEELLHGVLHFDTKVWRTLPLLAWRPGELTRRYIDGQRARFVAPLALFLFSIFSMFFAMSLASAPVTTNWNVGMGTDIALGGLQRPLSQARESVAQAEKALLAAREGKPGDPQGSAEAQARLEKAEARLAKAQERLDKLLLAEATLAPPPPSGAASAPAALLINTGIPTLDVTLDGVLRDTQKNPELALYRMKSTAYKFSFALIPLSLPFLWLMFINRRDVRLYDHAVFSLYSLSFMSLLFCVLALVNLTRLAHALDALLLLVPPLHMYRHLRGTYQLGAGGALWRTVALLSTAGTVFLMFIILVAWLGLT